ncbi:hypothetical protein JHK84_046933 [Glycine max]|nr:hypothetical protein JHK84_046933 [Glycine max]
MRDYMMPLGGLGGVPLREMPSWFERREVLGLKNGRSMDGNNYNSWADQWDDGPDPVMVGSNSYSNKNSNGNTAKYKQKLGEGFGKTKAVASTGVKKLKDGTSVGLHWIKAKYSKATQKH